MVLTADFHTHTTFSHGKGSILDSAMSAKEKGLKKIAITDHGYGHTVYGISHKKVPLMKSLCEEASKISGVDVVLGVETNILGISGKTDMKFSDMQYMEVYLAGIHKFITYESLKEWYLLLTKNFIARKLTKPSESLIKRNTQIYINAIKNNPIDILAHPGYCVFINAEEVAKCCADYGTTFEIDARKVHLSDDEWAKVAKTGVNFVIDSDAHSPDKIGFVGDSLDLIERTGISRDKILNIDGKIPEFTRFKEYKEKNL